MKKEKKRIIVLVTAIVLVVVVIILIQGYDKNGKRLKEIGYPKENIKTIVEKLTDEQMDKILTMEYQKELVSILEHKYYIPKNLETYLTFENDNTDDLIAIVNVNANNDWYTNTKEADTTMGEKMLVNKYNYLTDSYNPNEIVDISLQYSYNGHSIEKVVYNQFIKMWNDAKQKELTLIINSSYRTYQQQQKEYDSSNDDYAAKPGFSEHQTGLALDIVTHNTLGNGFESSKEFAWLQENSHKYGFILRYPKNKEYLTGYAYESWHYRYLGIDLAKKVHDSGLTFDEYYAYYCDYKKEC